MVNIVNSLLSNKLQRKLKGQSRMDNLEPLSTSDNTQTHMKLQSLQAFGKLKHNGKVTNSLDSIDIQIDYSLFFSIFYYRISTFAGI